MNTRTTTIHHGVESKQQEATWLKVPAACRRSSIGRTSLYALINEGRIKSCVVKKRGNIRGQRLISRESLDDYLNTLANGKEEIEEASSNLKVGF